MTERNEYAQDELLESSDTAKKNSTVRYHAEENKLPAIDDTGENVAPSIKGKEQVLPYAGFWMRFWAYLTDIIIVGSINRIIVKPIFKALDLSSDPGWFSPEAICTSIIFYLYFILMTKFLKKTLGKMIFGLKVVSLKEERLTWGTIVFREFIGRFISKTTIVGYIIVGLLPKKQGLHDIFADTTVILDKR
ncbi:RDD family protein [Peribacillus cavernae]|uniref:RDD family protein n=1 Tax=Peribacillus cavernae TaxID=1674310 RepID=A0A433HH04_9BACI|nr:RDD family protein [Peribacillus cavernae]MDQ0221078.1 putative RDD family membrane protein YckC [Peribacillus cavernae]RUQ27627.1 RDD family protein [Peribacillus cavernae]